MPPPPGHGNWRENSARMSEKAESELRCGHPASPLCLALGQSWLPGTESGFQPGEVRIAWTPEAIHVEASLTDRDVFNPETRFNHPAFLHGDVFEIFLQPPGATTYFEFHIGPDHQLFQLRIPSPEAFSVRRKEGIPPEWLIQDQQVERQVVRDGDGWSLKANIPVSMLETASVSKNQRWKMSFCRYDANRAPDSLILSSSSPLKAPDFHRIYEWYDVLMA